MALILVLVAMALSAVSGLPGIFMARASAGGQRVACGLMCAAALAGLAGACMGLRPGLAGSCAFPWPAAGNPMIGLDALSAFFLVPVFLFGGLGSFYGLGYWPQARHPGSARKLQAFWGLSVAGMGLLLVGKHALAFMLGWEIMALSAFFLITAEDRESESRRAGFIYLIATHLGTLALFGMFALWRWATGSFALGPIAAEAADVGALNALFFLALIGFGLKAGVMPLHFWLPGAHANAPSHVSAMLSGVMLKMGIYGLIRFLFLLPAPPASWGGLVLGLGRSAASSASSSPSVSTISSASSPITASRTSASFSWGWDWRCSDDQPVATTGWSSAWAAASSTSGTTVSSSPSCSWAPVPSSAARARGG